MSLVFAVLVDAPAGWRGVKITPVISRELDALATDSKAKPGIRQAARVQRSDICYVRDRDGERTRL